MSEAVESIIRLIRITTQACGVMPKYIYVPKDVHDMIPSSYRFRMDGDENLFDHGYTGLRINGLPVLISSIIKPKTIYVTQKLLT